jgi:hypothetical protein
MSCVSNADLRIFNFALNQDKKFEMVNSSNKIIGKVEYYIICFFRLRLLVHRNFKATSGLRSIVGNEASNWKLTLTNEQKKFGQYFIDL